MHSLQLTVKCVEDHRISERKHGWISTYAPKAERGPVDEVYFNGISGDVLDDCVDQVCKH